MLLIACFQMRHAASPSLPPAAIAIIFLRPRNMLPRRQPYSPPSFSAEVAASAEARRQPPRQPPPPPCRAAAAAAPPERCYASRCFRPPAKGFPADAALAGADRSAPRVSPYFPRLRRRRAASAWRRRRERRRLPMPPPFERQRRFAAAAATSDAACRRAAGFAYERC